ncbi:MAG: nitrite reductase small subunit NirD [Deltaproteobacteria bacterium]|nr:nitrite reductase small subunit NirD [Deltaproteobacteria bacterium]
MTGSPGFVDVCALPDIPVGAGVCALVDGVQVALFRPTASEVFALANRDPIGGAEVLSRGIVGDRGGRAMVASPLLKHAFCLRTGRCLDDDNVAVPTATVRIDGDRVLVERPQWAGANA